MNILSVNVSLPRQVIYCKKMIMTGIFKSAVEGKVYVSRLNLEGDGQSDLQNHGGLDKAVYAYPYEHYAYWRQVLSRNDFEYGQFGENLTVAGLDESEIYIGDQLSNGSVRFVVTQPRVPCFKLGIRFNNSHMPKKFMQSARTGCYLRVLEEGFVQAGDELHLVKRDRVRVSVKDLFQALYHKQIEDPSDTLRKALRITHLSQAWKTDIEKRLSGTVKETYEL